MAKGEATNSGDAAEADPTVTYLTAAFAALGAGLAQLVRAGDDSEAAAGGALTLPAVPSTGRLADLVEAFALDDHDAALLVCALAPAVDGRFGELYAGLDRPRGRTALRGDVALSLTGGSPFSVEDRARLAPSGRLRTAGLLEEGGGAGALPEQVLSVPERVVTHLLGGDEVDPIVADLLAGTSPVDSVDVGLIAKALAAGVWSVWVHDRSGGGLSIGATALGLLGAPAVVLDLGRLAPGASLAAVLPAALLEAGLRGGGVVAGPVDPVRDRDALRMLTSAPRPLVLVSSSGWDPALSGAVPLVVEAGHLDRGVRVHGWRLALERMGVEDAGPSAEDLATLRLSPERIVTAAASGAALAVAEGVPVALEHLRRAALLQGSTRLVQLAQRVVPRATIDDLVGPRELLSELESLPGRYETRHIVFGEWGLGRVGARGRGLTCLFAGPSGTGKTLAAEVVAHALGVDLFIVNLSQVVDKYIGETEKNLERVFTDAEGVNGVLLFDEADALFGKRSEVESAHDRYANIEVAYLLQRMERYDGVAVLTTNLRGNIDDAFARRLDVVCSFAEPTPEERRALWERHLPPTLPMIDDIDLALLAEHLHVSGGVIRNITVAAAHAAAVRSGAVSMADLTVAAAREYRKMGRLFTIPAFEPWLDAP